MTSAIFLVGDWRGERSAGTHHYSTANVRLTDKIHIVQGDTETATERIVAIEKWPAIIPQASTLAFAE